MDSWSVDDQPRFSSECKCVIFYERRSLSVRKMSANVEVNMEIQHLESLCSDSGEIISTMSRTYVVHNFFNKHGCMGLLYNAQIFDIKNKGHDTVNLFLHILKTSPISFHRLPGNVVCLRSRTVLRFKPIPSHGIPPIRRRSTKPSILFNDVFNLSL